MATYTAIALVTASTAVQMHSARKAAKAQERAMRAKAEAKRIQSEELLKRSEFNIEQLEMEAEEFQGEQISRIAKSGIGGGVGLSLSLLEQTQDRLIRAVNISRREAEYKAEQLRAGADIDTRLSSDIRSTSRRERVGIFLGGAAKASGLAEDL
tara:strand:+ start:974 stop:1435 length:462 start_codon:yes stop_codon:yes gene_type:complete